MKKIPKPSRRAVLAAVIIGVILHTLTALSVWNSWDYFGRANIVVWMDFPTSLAYLDLEGEAMLAWSLVAGGLQWAAIAALLTIWVGVTTHRRRT
ncbi:MAG TPA: hypothetical protein VNM67_03185 [Thermoanaerobaculia bacterium]|nr:hypothetical protein [Thermoanaerobaculia bacterium]